MNKLLSAFVILSLSLFLFSCAQEDQQQEESGPLLIEGTEPEVIAGPFDFTEGPYWHSDGYLIFSDIPANRVYRWSEQEGVDVYLEPSGNSNGIQADIDGSILLAQHAGRVSRLTADGDLNVIADSYEGRRLNSPNDIAVHSNGNIFFTDPPFGVSSEDRELEFSGVYMLTPEGVLSIIYDEFNYPNGLVFSADENRFFLNDSETGDILVFEVDGDGVPHSPELFANVGEMGSGMGAADGMVTDMQGNLYSTGPAGITILNSNGEQINLITFNEQVTNLEWGGEESDILFITGSDNVYRLPINTTGNKKR